MKEKPLTHRETGPLINCKNQYSTEQIISQLTHRLSAVSCTALSREHKLSYRKNHPYMDCCLKVSILAIVFGKSEAVIIFIFIYFHSVDPLQG